MKEFDIIVQVISVLFNWQYKTVGAFEIDGGGYVGSKKMLLEIEKKKKFVLNII